MQNTPLINYDAFSHGQIVSKLWLCEELEPFIPTGCTVSILGGWHNVLGFMMNVRRPNFYARIDNIDLDQNAIAVADKICNAWTIAGEVTNQVGDVENINIKSDVLISCSVEHFNNTTWFDQVPDGTIVCLQTVDVQPEEQPLWYITTPSTDLTDFASKFPLSDTYFAGTKRIQYDSFGYTRLMIIGEK